MFDSEPLIRARLETIPEVAGVHSVAELSQDGMTGRRLPAIFIAPDGYRVVDENPYRAQIAVRWLVVVAVGNAAQARSGDAARLDVATIVRAVIIMLLGWQPTPQQQPMRLARAPAPEVSGAVLYWPLAFETYEIIERSSE